MAIHTLKAKYKTKDDSTCQVCRIFCASKDQKEIYYRFEDKPEATSELDAPVEAADPVPTPMAAAPVVIAAPPLTATSGPGTSIKDVSICTVDILAIIIFQKLKKQLSEVPLSKSINKLSNSKSTL